MEEVAKRIQCLELYILHHIGLLIREAYEEAKKKTEAELDSLLDDETQSSQRQTEHVNVLEEKWKKWQNFVSGHKARMTGLPWPYFPENSEETTNAKYTLAMKYMDQCVGGI
jgi:hypothetical protein